MRQLLLAGAILLSAAGAAAAATAKPDQFDFTQAGRHVTVRYFVPAAAEPTAPVVIVMHGVGRNGEDYFNDWLPHAQARKFLLIVPEFSKEEFPGVECYNYGNTVDTAGRPRPRAEWSFSMIEPIFDAVRARTGSAAERYHLFGHSAGAQFVQRFIYFVPAARVARVVSANAGWYMLPDLATAFPYGLKNTPVTAADLRHALALPLVVLLGTADTDPEAKSLRHTPEADAQGLFRYARGQFFFARGEAAARAHRVTYGWRLATVPGVAHSDRDMAPRAVEELFRP
jgi:poly(3-hydroxybutyrate) depolymerase